MKTLTKHNISVPLLQVDAFLDAMDKPTSPEESARIAKEMIAALREARKKLREGVDDRNLTVCIGKVVFVNPADVRKLMDGKIPRLTVYKGKKDTRHMPLYIKHLPEFYNGNKPTPKPGARNKPPRKAGSVSRNTTKYKTRG